MWKLTKLTAIVAAVLALLPVTAGADASGIPGTASWYFFVDLKAMEAEGAGQGVYRWLADDVFAEVREEIGLDLEQELDRLIAYSMEDQGPVLLFEGNISQASRDKIMTYIAVDGDLEPRKSSGKRYYYLAGDDSGDGEVTYGDGKLRFKVETEDEAWISMDLKNKVLVTSTEAQMEALLASNGKIAGAGRHKGALVVLTAEKTLVQAGMNAQLMDDDGDSAWESNILRNTEQVAFLLAATADKLAIEAKLLTKEPDMAESLASVTRGLISLASLDDDMDADTLRALQGTRVEAKGNSLSISLAVDPTLVVATLRE